MRRVAERVVLRVTEGALEGVAGLAETSPVDPQSGKQIQCECPLRTRRQLGRAGDGVSAAELGFVAALAVADIVPAGRPLRVKWPNDVLVDGGKVAGILLESAIGQTGQVQHVVAGIGVNVGFAPQLPEMRYPGAALGGSVEAALEKLTAALAARLAEWRREGFATVRAAWLAKAGPIGAEVDVKLGEELVRGRFAGLDREGALLLDTAAGPRKIVSGELLGRAA